MHINQIIMYVIAFGAVLGGVDRMLGNRFGYGEKFENGFRMLGPVGLSMAGIICLSPLLSSGMGAVVTPLCHAIGMDPSIFGSILSLDMGGYSLALDLAEDARVGLFSGVIVSSVFGCTIVFTIPVGLAAIRPEDKPWFTRGILLGFLAMPFSIFAGGLAMGLPVTVILWNSLPVVVLCGLLALGVLKKPKAMEKGFALFGKCIQVISTFGLILAAVTHMTGLTILGQMLPLQQAMQTVSAIGIVMLGSMPLAELLQRLLRVPFAWISRKTGLNSVSTTGLILGLVSATPTLAMLPEMDKRGKVVCASCLVCCVGFLGSHLAFAINSQPDMVPALLVTKLVGAILGAGIALAAKEKERRKAPFAG